MNRDDLLIIVIVMLILLLFISIVALHNIFREIMKNTENLAVKKRFKKKWSAIYFTNIIFYLLAFYIISKITSVYQASIISWLITIMYMGMISKKMKENGVVFFENITNDNITMDSIWNGKLNKQSDYIVSANCEMRKLTINRIRAYSFCLVKIHVFVEADDVQSSLSGLTINGKRYNHVGAIPYAQTLAVDIPEQSTELLFCTFANLKKPLNISRYTISPGGGDIAINIKPLYPISNDKPYSIEQVPR